MKCRECKKNNKDDAQSETVCQCCVLKLQSDSLTITDVPAESESQCPGFKIELPTPEPESQCTPVECLMPSDIIKLERGGCGESKVCIQITAENLIKAVKRALEEPDGCL